MNSIYGLYREFISGSTTEAGGSECPELNVNGAGISADWNPQTEAESFLCMVRKGKCSLEKAREGIGYSERQFEVLSTLYSGSMYLERSMKRVMEKRLETLAVFNRLAGE